MSKCISVTLSDGQVISVNVDNNIKSLPKSDIEDLEKWVASVKVKKQRRAKIGTAIF